MIYFGENMKLINSDLDKLNSDFTGVFNYRQLTNDFYKTISDKLNKYLEKITQMKKYIFDTVNKEGNFEKIIFDNNTNETRIKQRFDNILNYQLDEKSGNESFSTWTKYTNTNSNKLSSYFNNSLQSQRNRLTSKFYQPKNSSEKNKSNI